MRKVFKVLVIILEIAIVAALIFGLIYLAKWVGIHDMTSAKDVLHGIK